MEVPAPTLRGPEPLRSQGQAGAVGVWAALGREVLSTGPAPTACQARSPRGPW